MSTFIIFLITLAVVIAMLIWAREVRLEAAKLIDAAERRAAEAEEAAERRVEEAQRRAGRYFIYLVTAEGDVLIKKGNLSNDLLPMYPNGWYGEVSPERLGSDGYIFRAPAGMDMIDLKSRGWYYIGTHLF